MPYLDRPSTLGIRGQVRPLRSTLITTAVLAAFACPSPAFAAPPDQPAAPAEATPEDPPPRPAAEAGPSDPSGASTPSTTAKTQSPAVAVPTGVAPAAPAPVAAPVPVEDAWSPWIGRPVRLRIVGANGEQIISGRLVAHSTDALAIAVEPTGQVASVRKDQVVEVAAMPLAPPVEPVNKRERRGTGLLIGGGVMAASGLTLAGSGAAYAAESPIGMMAAILIIPGLGLVGGGVGMLVVGAKRHIRHRKKHGFARITPTLQVGRERTQAGIAVTF